MFDADEMRLIFASRQMTHRVIINLPHNQKHVVRVRPDIPLIDLFRMAIEHRSLDPDRHEMRHPTQPQVVLDLAAPLSRYGVTEVIVAERRMPSSHPRRQRQLQQHQEMAMNGTAAAGKSTGVGLWHRDFVTNSRRRDFKLRDLTCLY